MLEGELVVEEAFRSQHSTPLHVHCGVAYGLPTLLTCDIVNSGGTVEREQKRLHKLQEADEYPDLSVVEVKRMQTLLARLALEARGGDCVA